MSSATANIATSPQGVLRRHAKAPQCFGARRGGLLGSSHHRLRGVRGSDQPMLVTWSEETTRLAVAADGSKTST